MRILVTGGCGFIGSHVVEALLARGDQVVVLDDLSTGKRSNLPTNAKLTVGDVADATLVTSLAREADAIIHLAAIASVQACETNWVRAHRTNAFGTVCVLNAAATSPKKPRVVYASSAAVYGDNPNLPLSEQTPPYPISVYGMDKWMSECQAHMAHTRFGVHSVGLRFFNVFGPRQDPNSPYSGVISIFANAAQADGAITMYGDGEQTRDFIYVADIVALILAGISAPDGAHIVNGCTGHATSLNQLADSLRNLSGHALPATYEAARSGDIRHSLGEPTHAETLLGVSVQTPLDDGLKALLASIS